jgi:hypothetical protein
MEDGRVLREALELVEDGQVLEASRATAPPRV